MTERSPFRRLKGMKNKLRTLKVALTSHVCEFIIFWYLRGRHSKSGFFCAIKILLLTVLRKKIGNKKSKYAHKVGKNGQKSQKMNKKYVVSILHVQISKLCA